MTTSTITQPRTRNDIVARIIFYAEYAFCFMAIAYFTGTYFETVTFFIGESFAFTLNTLFRYSIILFSFILIICRWSLSFSVGKRAIALWALFAWAGLSILWSEFSEVSYLSIRGQLLPVGLFGLYFSSRFSLKEQLKVLTIFFSAASLISFAVVFAIPELGRHPVTEFEGAWRGIFGHKNGLSAYMSLTLVLFLSSLLGKEKEQDKIFPQSVSWAGIVLIQTMIVASTSKTGLFLSIFMVAFLLSYKRFRWFGTRSMLVISLGTIVALTTISLIAAYWEPILTGIGRDPTLTGRTDIWQGAINYWFDKFWVGYGLDAFWDRNLPYAQRLGMFVTGTRRITYIVPHSHNGFLDTALALGFIGLSLFLFTLVQAYKRAFRSAYLLPHSHLFFAAGFLVYYTILNCVESTILNRVGFFFMLYSSIYISLLFPERELQALDDE